MSNDIKCEYKSVQAVRGMENRSIAKAQKEGGWELVDQTQGTLRTTLNFRRVKPETFLSKAWGAFRGLAPAKQRALAAAVAVLLPFAAVGIGIAAAEDQGATNAENTVTKSAESATVNETSTPSPTPIPFEETDQVITAENNKDLAALLAGSDQGPVVEEFAAKYEGKVIEFDANISAMANHGEYQTRYDILISAGDFSETHATGPNFQFRDVNTTNDLHLTGANIPDSISVRDNLRLVARVGDFDPDNLLFFLEPISTEFR